MKERLYKTARIAPEAVSPWPFKDFEPGEFVSVEYFASVYDAFTGKNQPVYYVSRDDRWAYLYATSLDSFCL